MGLLNSIYKKLKTSYLREIGFEVPERYQSSFVHLGGGAEVQYIYSKLIGDISNIKNILIVGVLGGRDYFYFKNIGLDVVAVDVGMQPDIDNIVCCNVEEVLPFDKGYFDIVLLGEVLEHLKLDVKALENIREVLKDDGRLIVSLPFYNDFEEGHMRIHSPESGKRLLNMGGFVVSRYLERPGLFWILNLNILLHGVSYFTYILTSKTAYKYLIKTFGEIEWRLGHIKLFKFVRKHSKRYGGYYLAYKGEFLNHVDLNRNLYTS